ncbi:SDR family NAD(P)-dependent oxidoreductase [Frankia sp. CcWB3]
MLIHSAAGGLGLAAVAVARTLGARVLATAGSEDKRRYLRELGIADVFDSRDLSWADGVRAATGGRGVDVVLNSLTGAAIPLGLDVLAEDGRFVEVGKKDIYGERTISLGAFRKSISLASVDLAGLMSRRPRRFARLFAELWDRVVAGDLAPLPVTTYPFAEVAEALRTMASGSHIGKFVLTDPASVRAVVPEPMPAGGFRPDGTYLVTGGLGALGLSLAEFFAERGAGAVALLGRSLPSAEAAARIEAIRAGGTRVRTFAVDVADAAALDATLTRLRGEMPPLRGVVHAAGLLDDATILRLRPEQIERVLAPKVDGARNLDAATAADPLDLFVMFSSAAALFGNAAQAAYAAGNAFMDTLAVARRRRGLPALSVQWGPFTQIGLAAQDANRGARLAERGMGGFTANEAWAALAGFLRRDEQVVGYVPLNLRQWFDAYPDTAAQKSWQVLRQAASAGTPAAAAGGAFLTHLRNGPTDARHDLVEAKVRELAGRVLRLDPKAIESQTPFKALGLDSLLSLELRNRLEATFGLTLSPTLLWTYGSSRALAGVLCERIFTTVAA